MTEVGCVVWMHRKQTMGPDLPMVSERRLGRRQSIRFFNYWSAAFVVFVNSMLVGPAHGERLAFRSYGVSDGLNSLNGACLLQDRAGYILVCSEHGLSAYDGRRFTNLGPAQGLRDGGLVYDVILTNDNRIAVRYADQLLISDPDVPSGRPPTDLFFRPVMSPTDPSFYAERGHQVAAYRHGLAVIVGSRTMAVGVSRPGAPPPLVPLGLDVGEQNLLDNPHSIYSVGGTLWEAFSDGRLCSANPGAVHCFGSRQGLRGGPWDFVAVGTDGNVIARSMTTFATINPRTGTVAEEVLPDQDGLYKSYTSVLSLFRTPSGEVATQSADGLIVRGPNGWRRLTTRDGIPPGVIAAVIEDREHQIWLQITGNGLARGIGYGRWETIQRNEGLSEGVAWQTVRPPGGDLWASSDTGVDEIGRIDGIPHVDQVFPGVSYALAVGPDGNIWSSAGESGVRIIDPGHGTVTRVPTPAVDVIVAGLDRRVWLGTEEGLFHADVKPDRPIVPVKDGKWRGQIAGMLSDGSGGVWLVTGGRLWHRRPDGTCVLVDGAWPSGGFEPIDMAMARGGHLWIGGAGGLHDFWIKGDHIVSDTAVSPSDIRAATVMAVHVDHRSWVWAGTTQGVSVFNGHRWVSVDTDDGLVWDDISQGGIREDPDGSVWIATDKGLSHLLDPAWLFAPHPVRIVISQASLGGKNLPVRDLPYTTAPLSLQFGTFSYAAERSIVFRYRLSGVDDGWAETVSGGVRYPSVPPGHHVLTVVGYDALSHTSSAPVSLDIVMDYPWWRQWWAELLYLLASIVALYGMKRWLERAAALRQRQLESLVEERTARLRETQAALERQATLDGLTGLLNRTEVQHRLARTLSVAHDVADLVVALIDLDHFKTINDRHGHLAGDDVLRAVGVRVSAILRDREYAGRYGGEELLVVLDDADGRGAARILALLQSVRGAPFHLTHTAITVTCSIGVAWAGRGDDWESLIGRADLALYEAKTTGRDKVVESRDDHVLSPSAWPRPPRAGRAGSTD